MSLNIKHGKSHLVLYLQTSLSKWIYITHIGIMPLGPLVWAASLANSTTRCMVYAAFAMQTLTQYFFVGNVYISPTLPTLTNA